VRNQDVVTRGEETFAQGVVDELRAPFGPPGQGAAV